MARRITPQQLLSGQPSSPRRCYIEFAVFIEHQGAHGLQGEGRRRPAENEHRKPNVRQEVNKLIVRPGDVAVLPADQAREGLAEEEGPCQQDHQCHQEVRDG